MNLQDIALLLPPDAVGALLRVRQACDRPLPASLHDWFGIRSKRGHTFATWHEDEDPVVGDVCHRSFRRRHPKRADLWRIEQAIRLHGDSYCAIAGSLRCIERLGDLWRAAQSSAAVRDRHGVVWHCPNFRRS